MARKKKPEPEEERDAASVAAKLRNVLSGDEGRLKRFRKEIEGRSDLAALFRETLLEDLREREFDALVTLLSAFPAVIETLLASPDDFPFVACRCLLDAAREAKLDTAKPLSALYKARKEEFPDGAECAVSMLETGHPAWVKTVLEQFSHSVDHAAEMAYQLRIFFEDNADTAKELETSESPEVRLVLARYREALDLLADEREGEDEIEFFAEADIATDDEPVKTFLFEVGNHIANTLLAMKDEEELEFLDYSAVRDFARRLAPLALLLARKESMEGGLLDDPDELHLESLAADPDREKSPELWLEFERYLQEMYGDRDLYRIDVFMWRAVAIVRDLVDARVFGMIDGDKRERFIVDLSAALTGRIEECLSCEKECPFHLDGCPDDPSRLIK